MIVRFSSHAASTHQKVTCQPMKKNHSTRSEERAPAASLRTDVVTLVDIAIRIPPSRQLAKNTSDPQNGHLMTPLPASVTSPPQLGHLRSAFICDACFE